MMKRRWRSLMVSVVLISLSVGTLAATAAPLRGLPPSTSQYLPIILRAGEPTANEVVAPYSAAFQYGLNPGYYGNGWDDNGVYSLCFNAGCRSVRNTLPDAFIAQWGTNVRLSTFAHATNDLNFREITTFLQNPRADWRDPTLYDGHQSKLWQGMDTPIWDDGANGTPVNDANRFALYVWTIVNTYGPYIRFYEIINEPDYTASSFGWAAAGTAGSWWNNPPQAKDLPNIRVPIYQYIRLLRIAYTVIHRYDPDAYVTPGGIGYPSFLDALLRYTDNPSGGTVTAQYPLTGGAYFDALSFHSYPQFGTRRWNGQAWVPERHSDKAVQVLVNERAGLEAVLHSRGYAGTPHPQKVIIATELNVPRKPIGETLGGATMQRNFTIKALVKAQQHGIRQMYWYATGETANYATATDPFTVMGFYENLTRDPPGQQKLTEQGIANRTTFEQLYGWTYDAAATTALGMPATVDGAAFRQGATLRYVLWAKTTQDQSETASATISLPGSYQVVSWNGSVTTASGTNLALTGAPLFLTRQP